eukprot:Clim_evm9s165 gene=Clim_evmTU9s165
MSISTNPSGTTLRSQPVPLPMFPEGSMWGQQETSKCKIEYVLGCSADSNASFACNSVTGLVAYPAGAIIVLYNTRRDKQQHVVPPELSLHRRWSTACASPVSRVPQPLHALCFSPDGKFLAVGEVGKGSHIMVWQLDSGSLVSHFPASNVSQSLQPGSTEVLSHPDGVHHLAFCGPDSRFLVSTGVGTDRSVLLWDWRTAARMAGSGMQTPTPYQSNPESPLPVAMGKAATRILSLSVSRDGSTIVTSGSQNVRFWSLKKLLDNPTSLREAANKGRVATLEAKSGLLGNHRTAIFVDIVCGKGKVDQHNTYAITNSGLLCCFGPEHSLDKWVDMKSKRGYSIDVNDRVIAVGLTDGVIRLFETDTLKYVGTLPKPHALGSESAIIHGKAVQTHRRNQNTVYPHAFCISLSQTSNKVNVVYSDRSLYVWDVTDVNRAQRLRYNLWHSECVWDMDVCPLPLNDPATLEGTLTPGRQLGGETPFTEGTLMTCGADDTVRFWNIGQHLGGGGSRGSTTMAPGTTQALKSVGNGLLLDMVRLSSDYSRWGDGMLEKALNPPRVLQKLYMGSSNTARCCVYAAGGKRLAFGDRKGCVHVFDSTEINENNVLSVGSLTEVMEAATNMQSATMAIDHHHEARYSVIHAHEHDVLTLSFMESRGSHLGLQSSFGRDLESLLVSGGRDRLVHVWDAALQSTNSALQITLDGFQGSITDLWLGEQPITGSSNENIASHSQTIRVIAGSQDHTLNFSLLSATVKKDSKTGTTRVDRVDLDSQSTLPWKGSVYGLSVDATGKYAAAVGADPYIKVYNVASARNVRSYAASLVEVQDTSLNRASEDRFQGINDALNCNSSWQQQNQDSIGKDDTKQSSSALHRVEMDTAGIYVAVAGSDRFVRIYDFYSGTEIDCLRGHSDLLTAMKFTPDCLRLITASADGVILVWRLPETFTATILDRMAELENQMLTALGYDPEVATTHAVVSDQTVPQDNQQSQASVKPAVDHQPSSKNPLQELPSRSPPDDITKSSMRPTRPPPPAGELNLTTSNLPAWAKRAVDDESGSVAPPVTQSSSTPQKRPATSRLETTGQTEDFGDGQALALALQNRPKSPGVRGRWAERVQERIRFKSSDLERTHVDIVLVPDEIEDLGTVTAAPLAATVPDSTEQASPPSGTPEDGGHFEVTLNEEDMAAMLQQHGEAPVEEDITDEMGTEAGIRKHNVTADELISGCAETTMEGADTAAAAAEAVVVAGNVHKTTKSEMDEKTACAAGGVSVNTGITTGIVTSTAQPSASARYYSSVINKEPASAGVDLLAAMEGHTGVEEPRVDSVLAASSGTEIVGEETVGIHRASVPESSKFSIPSGAKSANPIPNSDDNSIHLQRSASQAALSSIAAASAVQAERDAQRLRERRERAAEEIARTRERLEKLGLITSTKDRHGSTRVVDAARPAERPPPPSSLETIGETKNSTINDCSAAAKTIDLMESEKRTRPSVKPESTIRDALAAYKAASKELSSVLALGAAHVPADTQAEIVGVIHRTQKELQASLPRTLQERAFLVSPATAGEATVLHAAEPAVPRDMLETYSQLLIEEVRRSLAPRSVGS